MSNFAQITARQERRRGVTLIEAVLFISIALGLIVGGIVFFNQANTAQRTNDAIRNISTLASEVRALYRTQSDFAGLTATAQNDNAGNHQLIAAGAVPSSLPTAIAADANTITNEFGGNYDIAVAANAQQFTITTDNIPDATCTRIAQATNNTGPVGSGIANITVDEGDGNLDVTLTAADAATNCRGNQNSIAFTFAR